MNETRSDEPAPAESCDVLCIGSGAGGLTAAITAAASGAEVLVAESDELLGGATAYSGGQLWAAATDLALDCGITDSAAEAIAYLEALGGPDADPLLRDVFVRRGPEALRFLRDRGVRLSVVRGLPDYYYPEVPGSKAEGRILEIAPFDERGLGSLDALVATSPFGAGRVSSQDRIDCGGAAPNDELVARSRSHADNRERCAGPGLIAALVSAAAAAGAEFRTRTRAVRLLIRDGRVAGAVVSNSRGEEHIITARSGVVLATGGYDRDAQLTAHYERLDAVATMAPPHVRGDHLRLVADLQAAVATSRPPRESGVMFGVRTTGTDRGGAPIHRYVTPGLPHSIIVNATGRRFTDDAFHPDVVAAIADDPANWPAWFVVDATFRTRYPIGDIAPGGAIPSDMPAWTAGTPAALATAAGIDATGLEEEIETFNAACRSGRDRAFGRGRRPYTRALNGDGRLPNPNLGALERPPYTAFPLARVALNCPAAGLVTGADAAVLTGAGSPIPGLYAAGNAAAQRDIGATYNSGIGNQRGIVYGYLAGRALTTHS